MGEALSSEALACLALLARLAFLAQETHTPPSSEDEEESLGCLPEMSF